MIGTQLLAAKKVLNILIVDDDPGVGALMTYLLAREGHKIKNAINGKKAVAIGTSLTFDVILLDLDLPDMSGIEVGRLLKQSVAAKQTPIVCVSGNDSAERRAAAQAAGAVDFIAKPFINDDFLERVARASLRETS